MNLHPIPSEFPYILFSYLSVYKKNNLVLASRQKTAYQAHMSIQELFRYRNFFPATHHGVFSFRPCRKVFWSLKRDLLHAPPCQITLMPAIAWTRARAWMPVMEGPTRRNTCNSMGASNSMTKGKSMVASNGRANHRRNTCNSMGASNSIDTGKSMVTSNGRANHRRNTCNSMGASTTRARAW